MKKSATLYAKQRKRSRRSRSEKTTKLTVSFMTLPVNTKADLMVLAMVERSSSASTILSIPHTRENIDESKAEIVEMNRYDEKDRKKLIGLMEIIIFSNL
ncbi:hypothetical protein PanWU01x14_057080 [Parasponia andersonii]|uniref:Uncharacterized protein n=1 Tax=Parasponia andersonii TaxID=3476 RepID=A0A2P5DJS2_PARAD|nr:hypothetical protein PanWU01x14_057080 [Parasponia andersonii]